MSTGIQMTVEERNRLYKGLRVIGTALVVMWAIHLISVVFNLHMGHWGVFPRSFRGLRGILASPFLHGDWMHLLSNSFPIMALGVGLYYFFPRVADRVLLSLYFFSGLFLWIFGRSYNEYGQFIFHIGASGVVYGLVMFMLGTGLFRRNTKSTVLALIVLFFYSGIFLGFLPEEGISWDGHLVGATVGVVAAFYFRDELEVDELEQKPSWELEEESSEYFLPRDIFDYTREQRRMIEIERQRREKFDQWNWESDSTEF